MEGLLLAVTAVVITHNSEDVVQACLDSLAEFAPQAQRLVIDNASVDRTVERARSAGARVVVNRENQGFAGAVNQGFRETQAEASATVLVLNPDVQLRSGIEALERACAEHGLAAGQLVDTKGRAQAGFTIRRLPTPGVLILEFLGLNRLWPSNPWNRRYRYLDRDLARHGPVEQPAGAFLMVRHDVWERLEGFDEQFHPVWFEDVDFCKRAGEAGYTIWYSPSVQAHHIGGHSIAALPALNRQVYWYDSVLRYARKHFRRSQYWGVRLAAVSGMAPRAIWGIYRERSLKPLGSFLYLHNSEGRRLLSRPSLTEQRSGREK